MPTSVLFLSAKARIRHLSAHPLSLIFLLLGACAQTPIQPPPLDEKLIEMKVLQVIRENSGQVLATLAQYQQEQATAQQKAADDAQRAQISKLDLPTLVGDSPTLGDPRQKLLLFEFSDFQCPFCASASATLKKFIEKHDDEVTLVYKHLPLTDIHPEAERAARAAWAAGRQSKFWEYHDALFAQQRELREATYGSIATKLGLDEKKFDSDRRSDAAGTSIQRDLALGTQLQISGTPFFLMQDEPFAGALPLSALEEILQRVKNRYQRRAAALSLEKKELEKR